VTCSSQRGDSKMLITGIECSPGSLSRVVVVLVQPRKAVAARFSKSWSVARESFPDSTGSNEMAVEWCNRCAMTVSARSGSTPAIEMVPMTEIEFWLD